MCLDPCRWKACCNALRVELSWHDWKNAVHSALIVDHTWEVFLLGLKASVQGKLSFTLPFSLLIGKRVSTAVMDL